jgi:hypothetical protein
MKTSVVLLSILFASFFLISTQSEAQAQGLFCNVGLSCTSDLPCQTITGVTFIPGGGCPDCIACDLDPASPTFQTCQPLDARCDDGTACTTDVCFFSTQFPPLAPNGCQYTTIAVDFPPPDDLPIECYICEPTANNVLVDNGICDRTAGENCSNSPDCQEEGVACGTPPTPPFCNSTNINPQPVCQDGDRCTDDICTPFPAPSGISPQGLGPGTCSNPEKVCNPDSDGCCPAGCPGPDPATMQPGGTPCHDPTGLPIPNCDADCWFPQVCGDALVQPPETCDDNANMGDAGISPQGAIVTDTQCRDVGTPGECTYCGDGIIQAAAGEQCEFNDATACGTEGCDLTTCQCIQTLCVTGSGNIFHTIRPGCANCSFHPDATSQGWFHDYQAAILLAGLVGLGFVMRRRNSH